MVMSLCLVGDYGSVLCMGRHAQLERVSSVADVRFRGLTLLPGAGISVHYVALVCASMRIVFDKELL